MKIYGCANISTEDRGQFYIDLINNINEFQADNQEIEVQYKLTSLPNGKLIYSALVLGRK